MRSLPERFQACGLFQKRFEIFFVLRLSSSDYFDIRTVSRYHFQNILDSFLIICRSYKVEKFCILVKENRKTIQADVIAKPFFIREEPVLVQCNILILF